MMQQQVLKLASQQRAVADSTGGRLFGPLFLIVFTVELCISVVLGGPSFSEFASMAVFP
jgi:hypothetical protein